MLRQLQEAALQPPFVAKPLWADGREGAHGLAVLQDARGVEQVVQGDVPASLSGTLLLSPFVHHGGCLFKVLIRAHSCHICSRDQSMAQPAAWATFMGQAICRACAIALCC